MDDRRQTPWAPLGFRRFTQQQQHGGLLPPLDFTDLGAQSTEPPLPTQPWMNRALAPVIQGFGDVERRPTGQEPTGQYRTVGPADEQQRRWEELQNRLAADQFLYEQQISRARPSLQPQYQQGGPGIFGGIPRGEGY